jgi:copper chaperone CopZ
VRLADLATPEPTVRAARTSFIFQFHLKHKQHPEHRRAIRAGAILQCITRAEARGRKDIMRTNSCRAVVGASVAVLGAWLAGCASTGASSDGQDTTYTATAEESQLVASAEPLAAGPVKFYMNGLSCPLCATNIDQQLGDLPGVENIKVDLKTGIVTAAIVGDQRPAPKQIAAAADQAGVTLVKIER